jgi:hypothetical protein
MINCLWCTCKVILWSCMKLGLLWISVVENWNCPTKLSENLLCGHEKENVQWFRRRYYVTGEQKHPRNLYKTLPSAFQITSDKGSSRSVWKELCVGLEIVWKVKIRGDTYGIKIIKLVSSRFKKTKYREVKLYSKRIWKSNLDTSVYAPTPNVLSDPGNFTQLSNLARSYAVIFG